MLLVTVREVLYVASCRDRAISNESKSRQKREGGGGSKHSGSREKNCTVGQDLTIFR